MDAMINLETYECLQQKLDAALAIIDDVDGRYQRRLAVLKLQRDKKIADALKEADLPPKEELDSALADEKVVIKAQALKVLQQEWNEGRSTKTVKGGYADVTLPKTRKVVVEKGHELAVIQALAGANQFAALRVQSSTKLLKALDAAKENGVELSLAPDQVTIIEEFGLRIKVHPKD